MPVDLLTHLLIKHPRLNFSLDGVLEGFEERVFDVDNSSRFLVLHPLLVGALLSAAHLALQLFEFVPLGEDLRLSINNSKLFQIRDIVL